MGRHRAGGKSGGKPYERKRRKRERKKSNRGRGAPIGNIKNWIQKMVPVPLRAE